MKKASIQPLMGETMGMPKKEEIVGREVDNSFLTFEVVEKKVSKYFYLHFK